MVSVTDADKVYKMDCHCHPVAHRYYPSREMLTEITDSDKKSVQAMINHAIHRGLDAVAITDHNMCGTGLYGNQFAKHNKLPIIVVPGCECSVFINGLEVHVLALGLLTSFDYDAKAHIGTVVDAIHSAGGIAVLAHPHYYPHIYPMVKDIVDGIEYYNGVNACLYPSYTKFIDADRDGYKGIRTQGSDYHMTGFLRPEQREAVTLVDAENMYELWCRIGLASQ